MTFVSNESKTASFFVRYYERTSVDILSVYLKRRAIGL